MRVSVLLPFVLAFACTKHNPDSCCSTQDQCTSFGLSGITACDTGKVCNVDGACIAPQCTVSSDCTDAGTPICDNQVCVASCTTDDECSTISGRPYCGSAGACVACKDDTTCTAQDPVCDGSANFCRGCEEDSECSSGVCLESNGTCPASTDVIFVRDDGVDTGDCTQSSPCLTIKYALSKISPRNVIKILSTSYGFGSVSAARAPPSDEPGMSAA